MEASIFLPTFKEYAKTFFNIIKDETKIKADFKAFKNTSVWERFMQNSTQFAAAKSVAQNKMLKELLFDDKGVRRGYSEFKRDAKAVTDVFNETWLRVEYDTGVRMAVSGDQFRAYREDADVYPYWVYLETTSANPRIEHLELVGNIYRIGDADSDAVFPPGSWNCSCGSEQLDDKYLDENNKYFRTNEEAADDLQYIDPQFRINPADGGILPKSGHSYFQALSSANEADGSTFGITGNSAQPTKLRAVGLHLVVQKLHEWKLKHHSDHDTITFQCEPLLTNVEWNGKSFHNIRNHPEGFDQLEETITSPDEVWAAWRNATEQKEVLRNYIRGNYVVQTDDGKIVNAYLVDNVSRFRKGVIVY